MALDDAGIIAAVAEGPEGILGVIEESAGEELGSWAMQQALAAFAPDPTQEALTQILLDLQNIKNQLSTIETELQAIYELIDWATASAWAGTYAQNIIGLMNGLTGPQTAEQNYNAIIDSTTGAYNSASALNAAYLGISPAPNTPPGLPLITQFINDMLRQAASPGTAAGAPTLWHITASIKSYLTLIFGYSLQAYVLLGNALNYAVANLTNPSITPPISPNAPSALQTQMGVIQTWLTGQMSLYQQVMPMWLQILDSLSNVNNQAGAKIGWTNWASLSYQAPQPFCCAINFPSAWPAGANWYAAEISFGSFPVSGDNVSSGDPSPAPQYAASYMGIQNVPTPPKPWPPVPPSSGFWNLRPLPNGSFYLSGRDNQYLSNLVDWIPGSSCPAWPLPVLNQSSPVATIWLVPSAASPERVLIYMSFNVNWAGLPPYMQFARIGPWAYGTKNFSPTQGEYTQAACPTPLGLIWYAAPASFVQPPVVAGDDSYLTEWLIQLPGVLSGAQSTQAPLLTSPVPTTSSGNS